MENLILTLVNGALLTLLIVGFYKLNQKNKRVKKYFQGFNDPTVAPQIKIDEGKIETIFYERPYMDKDIIEALTTEGEQTDKLKRINRRDIIEEIVNALVQDEELKIEYFHDTRQNVLIVKTRLNYVKYDK